MKIMGHETATRIDRPDSVTDPFDKLDDEMITGAESFGLFVCILLGVFFGAMVGHGYYLWLLQ